MNLAKQINKKLDEILNIRAEIKAIGGSPNKDSIILSNEMINQIKGELNEITNNGLNVKEIFTNKYYINDVMQDRELVRTENNKESS
jgi:hypothetical protein